MLTASVKVGSFISLLAILLAVYYRDDQNTLVLDQITAVSRGLLKLEDKHTVGRGDSQPRVAIGYGACHDLFIDAVNLLNYDGINGEPQHFDDISSMSQFLQCFAYYFRHGAAAERVMSNDTLFDEIIDRVKSHPTARWALGGNAPLMANQFAQKGCRVLLAARMNDNLKKYIAEDIIVFNVGEVEKEDVHLILEYKSADRWGPYTAPRANRFILHNDNSNPMITSLDNFDTVMKEFNPDLLVVSGLQMMDNYKFQEGVRETRLGLVREQLLSQPQDTLIHFEMASYVEIELLQQLLNIILPHADSIGMNEQELVNINNVLEYGNVSVVADSNPRVAVALDQIRNIFKLIRMRQMTVPHHRKLTRIHVHTLAYQAIVTVKDSKWKQTMAAAAKASLTAHRYVCGSDSILLDKTKLVMDDSFATSTNKEASRIMLEPTKPVSCWHEKIAAEQSVEVEICVAPVLVCTEVQRTAGAGDNISAAGLILQI